MQHLKARFKNLSTGLFSTALVLAIFGLGFFFGRAQEEKTTSALPPAELANFGSAVSGAKTDADFSNFWRVWNELDQKFVGSSTPKTNEKIYGAIEGLTASYGDPYTVFFSPEESKAFEEEISGSFSGVGMEIGIREGALVVVSPIVGTPAARAGVRSGDKIIKIDNTDAVYLPVEKAVKLIRGAKGTEVKLTLSREGAKAPVVITVIRDTINVPTVNTDNTRTDGIFVIHLYSFNAQSMTLFRSALREFIESGKTKLILDLRNNPGGYLEAAVDMGSFFLPSGKIIVTEHFGGKRKEDTMHRSRGYNVFNDNFKFVVLVNKGSASASEILGGALQDHKKAILIGEKTFGKGSVQELVKIGDTSSLKITIAKWLTPNGTSISDGGLTPDILVPMTFEEQEKKGDLQLERAVKFLLES